MSTKRDMLDDIIDIKQDLSALSQPLGQITQVLTGDKNSVRVFDPRDYKEKPRANALSCLNVGAYNAYRAEGVGAHTTCTCHACMDVCPVDAIDIKGSTVKIADTCRACGLCVAACPTEAFIVSRFMAKSLYDRIAKVASMYEVCYITCTRALGKLPRPNEILLPCLGVVPREVWIALLQEYSNISVYLPVGVCDKCKTTTGELAYTDEIGAAEEFIGKEVGIEVDRHNLNHDMSRAFLRQEFLCDVGRAGQTLLAAQNPVYAGVQAVTRKIQKHSNDLFELQCTLEKALGDTTTSYNHRLLTQKRKLLLSVIQKNPQLAAHYKEQNLVPVCDMSACTVCSACTRVCPVNACNLDEHGRFSVQTAYCVNCSACALVCPEQCIVMKQGDTHELIVRDEEAIRLQKEARERKERVAKIKERTRKQVERGLHVLERLSEDNS